MQKPVFSSLAGFQCNNFDFLRFVLAALVLLSHSCGMLTHINHDPLLAWTRQQITLGEAAVDFFFVISGFLITHSWLRSRSVASYFKKRFLRISPGLGGALLFCVFVAGPLGGANLMHYFHDPHTYALFKTFFFADPVKTLPGVFAGNINPDINGPLWTIRYEFGCYLVIATLGIAGFFRWRPAVLILFIAEMSLYQLQAHLHFVIPHLAANGFPRLLNYYLAGAVFYLYRDTISFSPLLLGSACGLVLLGCFAGMSLILPLCGTYILLYLAYSPAVRFSRFARHGDISYGVYLYGWPVQQLLIYHFQPFLSPLTLFLTSLVITCLVAAASWRFVEAPFLRLKKSDLNAASSQTLASEHIASITAGPE